MGGQMGGQFNQSMGGYPPRQMNMPGFMGMNGQQMPNQDFQKPFAQGNPGSMGFAGSMGFGSMGAPFDMSSVGGNAGGGGWGIPQGMPPAGTGGGMPDGNLEGTDASSGSNPLQNGGHNQGQGQGPGAHNSQLAAQQSHGAQDQRRQQQEQSDAAQVAVIDPFHPCVRKPPCSQSRTIMCTRHCVLSKTDRNPL